VKALTTTVLFFGCLSFLNAGTLLHDDFEGSTIDSNLWTVTLPFAHSQVAQSEGKLTTLGRGVLATAAGYDGPIVLTGRMTPNHGYEHFAVILRCDLSVSPSFSQFHLLTGVEVAFSTDNRSVYINKLGPNDGSITILASVPFVFQVGKSYDFAIVDDKTNVLVVIDGTLAVSAVTEFSTGNKIAFDSREYTQASTSLDFVDISEYEFSVGPPVEIHHAIEVSFPTQPYKLYRIQASADLLTWTNVGGVILGLGDEISRTYSIRGASMLNFRVAVAP
jgi:hypothetical protein